MDVDLLSRRCIDKLKVFLEKVTAMRAHATKAWELKKAGKCPYKLLTAKGRTYLATNGGYVMGFTIQEFCEAIAYGKYWALPRVLDRKKLPRPNIEVFKDNEQVLIYDSETARKVSEYLNYSYKKPLKLIKSYNEYTKGNKDE